MAISESTEGIIYNGRRFLSAQSVEILDLIAEGEIEGLASGNYFVNGVSGEIGWRNSSFSGFQSLVKGQEFLRSVYWNETPVIDDNGRYNFQNVSLDAGNGTPDGNTNLRLGERTIINENFSPITTIGSKKDFVGPESIRIENHASPRGFAFVLLEAIKQSKSFKDKGLFYSKHFSDVLKSNFTMSHGLSQYPYISNLFRFRAEGLKFVTRKQYQLILQLGLKPGSKIMAALTYVNEGEAELSAYEVRTSTKNPETFFINLIPNVDVTGIDIFVQGPCHQEEVPGGRTTTYTQVCDSESPTLFVADVAQVQSVSSGPIPTRISIEKEPNENFILRSSAVTSFNPSLLDFSFQDNLQGWESYGGATASHSVDYGRSMFCVPAASLAYDDTYGGTFYRAGGSNWLYEQEGSISIAARTTSSSGAKIRFSLREDNDSNVELLRFSFDITNQLKRYDFFSIANRNAANYRIYLSILTPGSDFIVDFLKISRAMMRVEIDLPRRLELFKKYNFSIDADASYGSASAKAGYLPLTVAISNRQYGVELMSSKPNTSTVKVS